MALSDRKLKLAKPRKSVYRLREGTSDPELKGFGVTVAPAGSKTFFMGYTSPVTGKRRQLNLGRYPALSLKVAREKARAARAVVDRGDDPALLETTADTITLGGSLELYARAKLDTYRTGRKTERDLKRDFFSLLEYPVTAVTSSMVAGIIDKKAQSAPVMANRLLGYAKPWFRWMAARGHIPESPIDRIEKPSSEKARERYLSAEEIKAVWRASDELGYPFGPMVKLLMLTGSRRDEVAGMQWDEFDFENRIWNLPADRAKTKTAVRIPLSQASVDILQSIPRMEGPYVFTTTGTSYVSGFSKMKKRLDQLSGVAEWRLHDYRRTMVTTMAELGIDATTADRCLNHSGAATMSTVLRVYQRSDMLEQRRRAIEAWAEHLTNIV